MVDSVIVTVFCDNREFDMEFPAKVKFSQLKTVIIDALLRKGIRVNNNAKFTHGSYTLQDTDTLFETGVWDGSYLKVT